MHKVIRTILILFLGGIQILGAQETESETIETQTVTVTKAYAPTVSDAFKLKTITSTNDSITLPKKDITYTINSVPVASTFMPVKGKASKPTNLATQDLLNSFALLGIGNYGTVDADFYTNRSLKNDAITALNFNHRSSQGGIDEVALSNKYADSYLGASYEVDKEKMHWNTSIGFQHQYYNWYGLPTDVLATTVSDENQNYLMGTLAGSLSLEDSFFKKATMRYRRFWDATESGEDNFIVATNFEFPVNDELLNIGASMDYIKGSFKNSDVNSVTNTAGINYGFLQVGIQPNIEMERDGISLKLGVDLTFNNDLETGNNNFYVYPNITASYEVLEDLVTAYGGIQGALEQHSYYYFAQENPFVSPTLTIAPTDSKYNAFIGAKGKLASNISYDVKGSYRAINNSPLFKLNPLNNTRNGDGGFYSGNSFSVFYDDLKVIGLSGAVSAILNSNVTIGLDANVQDYTTETGNPAWNLSNVEATFTIDYELKSKWFLGGSLFFMGERKDAESIVQGNQGPSGFPTTIKTLPSFLDVNIYGRYALDKQWSFFAKAANLTNNNYQQWTNFEVQGFQLLVGASYQFDL